MPKPRKAMKKPSVLVPTGNYCGLLCFFALLALLGGGETLRGAIYTYDIRNIPSEQSGATVVGNITIDTSGGTESPVGSGNFYVGHSAIIAWNFTVTPSGAGAPYSGSITGINASATGLGGSFAMYATPSTLAVVSAGSLTLESDFDVPGADVSISWINDSSNPFYYSGGTGVGGATWLTTDEAALDAAFPETPGGGANNWTIATAVPEPGTAAFLGAAGFCWLIRRRRTRGS